MSENLSLENCKLTELTLDTIQNGFKLKGLRLKKLQVFNSKGINFEECSTKHLQSISSDNFKLLESFCEKGKVLEEVIVYVTENNKEKWPNFFNTLKRQHNRIIKFTLIMEKTMLNSITAFRIAEDLLYFNAHKNLRNIFMEHVY